MTVKKKRERETFVYVLTALTPEGESCILSVYATNDSAVRRMEQMIEAEPDDLSHDDFMIEKRVVLP